MEGSFFEGLLGPLSGEAERMLALLVAALLGGVVGLERERSGKPAGFRTHLLICLGAALLTEISITVANTPEGRAGLPADPGRIAAQIVSGIGFLGAGTIIQARGSVVGLTTAASIWVVAAIGMAVGSGSYVLGFGATMLVVVALRLLGQLEARLGTPATLERTVDIELEPAPALLDEVTRIITSGETRASLVGVERGEEHYVASFRTVGAEESRHAAIRTLLERPGIRRITLR